MTRRYVTRRHPFVPRSIRDCLNFSRMRENKLHIKPKHLAHSYDKSDNTLAIIDEIYLITFPEPFAAFALRAKLV